MTQNIKPLIQKAIRIVSGHPLARALPKEIIHQWMVETARVDPQRIAWHAERTLGIGGSEIFKAVVFHRAVKASAKGEHYDAYTMSSIQDVVKGKLFLQAPQKPDSNMRRGILNEPLADQLYIEKLKSNGCSVELDVESSKALRKYSNEKHPWHKYNEDRVLIVDGERILIDYKVPSPDQYGFSTHVEEDYVFQLHSGYEALRTLGIKVDRLRLVKLNVIDCEVHPIDVPIDEKLCDELISAGDYVYQNYILKNRLPEYQPSLEINYTLSEIEQMLKKKHDDSDKDVIATRLLEKMSHKLALSKTLAKAAGKYHEQVAKDLTTLLKSLPIDLEHSQGAKVAVGGVEISYDVKEELNEPMLLAFARSKGIDLESYASKKYDLKSLAADMRALAGPGDNAGFITSENVFSVGCTRKTKGITAEALAAVQGVSDEIVHNSLSALDSPECENAMRNLDDEVGRFIIGKRGQQEYLKSRWADAISTLTTTQDELAHETFDLNEGLDDLTMKP